MKMTAYLFPYDVAVGVSILISTVAAIAVLLIFELFKRLR